MPGSLIFYRSFALATGGDENAPATYLERCGTHLHRLLTESSFPLVAANMHEVVWMAHPRLLSALTLPDLRPFTIRLPNRLLARTCSQDDLSSCLTQIALTNHRLYVLTSTDPHHLWAAPDSLPAKRKT